VAVAVTDGRCTTALLMAERLLRAVDDGGVRRRPSPPATWPVGMWVAAPVVAPGNERMNATWTWTWRSGS